MSYQLFLGRVFKSVALTLLTAAFSFSAVIYDSGVLSLKTTDPTQLGRLSRNGVPSDWSAQSAFPGVLNPTLSYHYETFAIPTSPFPYLQISFSDLTGSGNLFASGYLNAYTPNSTAANRGLDVNYRGDAGSSSGFFPAPDVFQVVLPASSRLVVVVNETTPGAAIGTNFSFLVEGFYDTSFNDTTPPVPEPATMALSGTGFAIAVLAAYRRNKKQNS